MNVILKAIACVLISVVLFHTIPKDKSELSLLLSITVCCVVVIAALSFIKPILDFVRHIETVGNLNSEMVSIVIKSVGIGLLSEIAVIVCKDMGNGSMAKALQILATTVLLWVALPVFESLFSLIESVLDIV